MRDTLKRLARLTAGYSLVTLLGPLFTIFLTPLYTRALSPADYGVVDVALTLSSLVYVFAVLGLDQALGVYFFDGDDTHQRNLVTTALACIGGIGLVCGVLLVLAATPLAQLLFKDPARNVTIYVLALNAISMPIYAVVGAALRLRVSVRRVNALGLSALLVTVVSNVVLVLVLQLKATGVVAANAITNGFACALGLVLIWKPLSGHFSSALLKSLLNTGASLLPGVLGYLLLQNADRLMLTQYVSQTDIGLYAIANKLATMVYVLLSAALTAWQPMALEMAKQPEARPQLARVFEYFAAAAMFLSLAIGIFAPEILAVFTRAAYVPAAPYALALLIYSGPLVFLTGCVQVGLYAQKRTHLVSVAFIIAAIVNIALNLLLMPTLGVWGATAATVLAGVVWMFAVYTFSQRVMRVRYRWLRASTLAVVYLGLVSAFLLFPILDTLIVKVGAMLLFVLAVMAVGILTPNQIRLILHAARYRVAS